MGEMEKRTACRDITCSQRHPTLGTYQVQPSEVIALAQRLLLAVCSVDREELRGDDLTAVL